MLLPPIIYIVSHSRHNVQHDDTGDSSTRIVKAPIWLGHFSRHGSTAPMFLPQSTAGQASDDFKEPGHSL